MRAVISLLRGLLAAWLCAGLAWAQTTVPVYLPGYDASDWKALRGSAIKSVRGSSLSGPFWATFALCLRVGA